MPWQQAWEGRRADPLVVCEICHGQRILIDICGESVCAWCDGTGLAHALPEESIDGR